MALVPWSPLKNGFLSGKYRRARRSATGCARRTSAVIGATRTMLQFAGATVDGESSTAYPPLLQSDIRY